MVDMDKLQRLIDKDEIATALQRWSNALGRCDWDRVRELFHDDAIDTHGTFDGEIDAFVAWQKQHHDGIEQSVHFLSPVDVEFADADTALVQTYVTVYQRFGVNARQPRLDVLGPDREHHAKPMQGIMVGRYIDRFERRDGAWKVASRLVAFEWLRVDDAPWDIPFQAHWTAAKRDRSDPIYEIRKQMGLPD
jgi:hypothetical protein